MALISIIIPTYNSSARILDTVYSLIDQSYDEVEIIIQDGFSTDNTVSNVNNLYNSKVKVYIEEDKGVYDAMNNGLLHANGEYVMFMGAGDVLFDKDVLCKVNNIIKTDHPDILYGYVMGIEDDNKTVKMNCKLDFWYTIKFFPVCHQAIVAKKQLFSEKKFDSTYKVCADQDWLMYMKKKRKKIKYIDLCIAKYPRDGISSSKEGELICIKEQNKIHRQYYPFRKLVHDIYYSLKKKIIKI